MQPVVFVSVEGGLADYTAFGPVRVVLVDWDAIRDAYNDEEAPERIAEYREEIATLPDADFKAGLVAALDELERRHRAEPQQTSLEIAVGCTDLLHEAYEGSDGRRYPHWVDVVVDVSVKFVKDGVPLGSINVDGRDLLRFSATAWDAEVAAEGVRGGSSSSLPSGAQGQ